MSIEENNYYAVLQVDSNAAQVDIDASYRRLARLYHPDRNDSAFATAFMQELNVAYSVLRDPRQRLEYDKVLDAYNAQRRTERRQRVKSLNRWLVVPTLVAIFACAFVVLGDPATRIGSRSIRPSDIKSVIVATQIATRIEESNALVVVESNQSPTQDARTTQAEAQSNESPPQPSVDAPAIQPTASLPTTVNASLSGNGGGSARIEPGKTESSAIAQTVALKPMATETPTATPTSTSSPTSTPVATQTHTPASTPTDTSIPTDTLIPTNTSTPVLTATHTPISMPTIAATSTPVSPEIANPTLLNNEIADSFRGIIIHDATLYSEPRLDTPFTPVYAGGSFQAVARTADGLWYRLDNGYWIEARFVSPNETTDAGAEDSAALESRETPIAKATQPSNLKFPWDGTALRDSDLYSVPGQENAIVAGLFKGTVVTVIGISNDGQWYQLNDGFWLAVDAVALP